MYVDFEGGLVQLEENTPEGEVLLRQKSYVHVRDPLLRRWNYKQDALYRVTIEEVEDEG